jgi:uncharacterized SAM-dependent methyltransferase
MKEGDVLLIGNGLNTQNAEDILKSYNNKEVDNFLCKIPLQVGLSQESVRLGARFRNSRVELYYTILADREIIFQGKRIVFNKGDQIIIAVSYKYEKNDFIAFMKMYFDDVKIFFTQNNSYALVLCKK